MGKYTPSMTYLIADEFRVTSEHTVSFPGSTTYDELVAFNTFYKPILENVIEGTVYNVNVNFSLGPNSNPLGPDGTDVRLKGSFTWNVNNGAPFTMTVPTWREDLVDSDRRPIITGENTDPGVVWALAIINGDGTIQPSNYLGNDITSAYGLPNYITVANRPAR